MNRLLGGSGRSGLPFLSLRLVVLFGLLLPGPPNAGSAVATGWLAGGVVGWVLPAAAQSARSGGYGRPSAALGSVRRPSSGGYSRPSGSGTAGTSSFSGGDRSISRAYSGQALQRYQQQQAPPSVAAAPAFGDRRPSALGASPGSEFVPGARRPSAGYFGGSGYGGGLPYAGNQSRFGAWDAVFLWSMLNAASSSSRTQFYRDNRDNPDYLAWRREADRAAQQDPEMAARLANLDAAATDPGRRPPALPDRQSGGLGIVLLVIVLTVAAFLALRFMRRRGVTTARAAAGVPGLSGSAQSRFRVGMTFPLDPSPFLLAAGATKVTPPQGEGLVSVQAVGLATDGSVPLHRLYLPGNGCFLQLHLAGSDEPDECRYFSRIDEVTPASADEWGFWLDPAQGMIGWPQFQTKDGKLYDRVWAPGASRVQPRQQTETMQDAQGTRQRKLLCMLYGARTGGVSPAPDTEYILVSAIDDALASTTSSLTVALKAMQDSAAKDLASADAASSKARMLRPSKPEQDDPNIAAAMATSQGRPALPQTLSDRLSALRAKG